MSATEMIDYLMENVMDDFPELDKIPYKANYLDKHMEKIMDHTLAYYMSPAIDDEENNLIYVNGAHPDGMWTTLSHEGCPGHMFQNTYFQATNPKPIRAIQGNLGYMEGWAVYSSYSTLSKCDFGGSQYAAQLGQLLKINEDLGYLLYGRIDLGVNFEGWTEDDVKKYLEKSGYGTDIAEDIMTTVIGDPGVYPPVPGAGRGDAAGARAHLLQQRPGGRMEGHGREHHHLCQPADPDRLPRHAGGGGDDSPLPARPGMR